MGVLQSLADRLRDLTHPLSPDDKAVKEAGKEIGKARQLHTELVERVNALMAESRKLKGQIAAAGADAKKWADLAQAAAQAGKTEDVRLAVTNRMTAEAQLAALQQQQAKDDQLIAQLEADLDHTREKIATAEHGLTQLSARKDSADIRIKLAKVLGEDLGTGPTTTLGTLAQTVESKEAEASAWDELFDPAKQPQAAATSGDAVDKEVAALMQQAQAGKTTQ